MNRLMRISDLDYSSLNKWLINVTHASSYNKILNLGLGSSTGTHFGSFSVMKNGWNLREINITIQELKKKKKSNWINKEIITLVKFNHSFIEKLLKMVNYAKLYFIIKPTDKETSNITYDMIP